MERQKIRQKLVAQNKGYNIQIVNYVMLLVLLKKVWLCKQQAGHLEFLVRRFAIKYLEELP